MAEADKDGRADQVLSDLHATTGMALVEHAREAAADFEREMAKVRDVIESGPAARVALLEWARPCIADQDPGLWGDQA